MTTEPVQEVRYRQAFLLTHKSFATAEEVLDHLFEQFHITPPTDLSSNELEQWKERRLRPTRRRVLTVLQVWADEYGLLQDDHHLAPRVVNFVSAITSPLPLANAAREVLKSLERFVSDIITTVFCAVRLTVPLPDLGHPRNPALCAGQSQTTQEGEEHQGRPSAHGRKSGSRTPLHAGTEALQQDTPTRMYQLGAEP